MDTRFDFRTQKNNLQRIATVFWEKQIIDDATYSDLVIRLIAAKSQDDIEAVSANLSAVCKGKTYRIKAQGFKIEREAKKEKA